MKKSSFNTIIKGKDETRHTVKPYAMREMPFLSGTHEVKDRFTTAQTLASWDTRGGVERLLQDIEEREKYIKQVSDKTHNVEKEAYEKGFAQGEKAGRELGEKRFEALLKSFTEVLEEVKRLKVKLYQESEQEMVQLVLAIARRVIQREVHSDPIHILNVIRSALTGVCEQELVKVRLHPSDFAYVRSAPEEMGEAMRKVLFEADEMVARGDAVVECTRGVIECGIEHHLKKLEEGFEAQQGKYSLSEGVVQEEKETHDAG